MAFVMEQQRWEVESFETLPATKRNGQKLDFTTHLTKIFDPRDGGWWIWRSLDSSNVLLRCSTSLLIDRSIVNWTAQVSIRTSVLATERRFQLRLSDAINTATFIVSAWLDEKLLRYKRQRQRRIATGAGDWWHRRRASWQRPTSP